MSKANHRRGTKSNKDSERKPSKRLKNFLRGGKYKDKRHQKNPEFGRPLTGSVHAADYPDGGFNSRIRQRENAAVKKMASELDE